MKSKNKIKCRNGIIKEIERNKNTNKIKLLRRE